MRCFSPAPALLALFFIGVAGASAQVPDMLTREGAGGPFFVSRTAATSDDGSIRWKAFDASSRPLLQREVSHRLDSPCEETTVGSVHVSGPIDSLGDMMVAARAAYLAEIVSMKEGFDGAVPSTLIAAAIRRVVRGPRAFPRSGVVYVIYPQADFRLGGVRFCNAGTHASYVPQAGDRVLIFAFDPPKDTTHAFLLTRPEQLLFERGDRLFTVRAFANEVLTRNGARLSAIERATSHSRSTP